MSSKPKSISCKDFPNICRLCFGIHELLNIFINPAVTTLFECLTDAKVKEDDELPKNICVNCIAKLEDISMFIEGCKSNNAILQAIVSQEKNEKLEVLNQSDFAVNGNDIEFVEEIQLKFEEANEDGGRTVTVKIIKNETELDIEQTEVKEDPETEENEEVFPCKYCDKKFEKLAQLKNHVYSHKERNYLCCDKCKRKFVSSASLVWHMRSHAEKSIRKKTKPTRNKFQCVYCSKCFTRHHDLKRHSLIHQGLKLFCCGICGKKFSQKGALLRHSFLHTGEFTCSICNRPFTRESQLNSHMSKFHYVTKDKTHIDCLVCNFCGISYTSKQYLLAHMKTHTDNCFKCDMCKETFPLKSALTKHYLTHTGVKEFKCDQCKAAFTSSLLLKRHKIFHKENSVEKQNLTCSKCGKFFLFRNQLERHKTIHESARSQRYKPKPKTNAQAKTEQESEAEKNFLCSYCGKTFSQSASLNVHLKVHTGERFKCALCDKSYSTKMGLKYHLMFHNGEKPFPCPYCDKKFRRPNLYRHLLIHKGDRKFKCTACGKAFLRTDQLKQHLVVHKI